MEIITTGRFVSKPEEVDAAISELVVLAKAHTMHPDLTAEQIQEWFDELPEHERDHLLAYLANTNDEPPEAELGIRLDGDGYLQCALVMTPVQDTKTQLRITCAPRHLAESDRGQIKELLRRQRQAR